MNSQTNTNKFNAKHVQARESVKSIKVHKFNSIQICHQKYIITYDLRN